MEVFESFQAALDSTDCSSPEELAEVGLSVSGTLLEDGSPRYFVVERDLPDDEIHDLAFQVRYGRPIGEYERWVLDMARRTA